MNIKYITDAAEASRTIQTLTNESILGIDIETCALPEWVHDKRAALDPYKSRPRLLQAATLDGRVAVFDLNTVPVEILQPLSSRPWAVFNGQFEWRHLTHAGLTLPRLHDVMLMDRLVTGKVRSLGALADLDKEEQLSDWGAELSTGQIEYAARDALETVRQAKELLPKIPRRLYDLWCDTIPSMARLTLDGQEFDWDAHHTLAACWDNEFHELLHTLDDHLGGINPGSTQQVGLWIEQNMEADALAKWPTTATGRLSVSADTLALYADHPMVQPLLRYKAIAKLRGTYNKGYLNHRHPVTGRLHPEFLIGTTTSGRLACSRPNVQNPPRDAAFRALFIPPEGHVLVGADFSQIELRVAALLSGDRNMLAAYSAGIDMHAKTASVVSGTAIENITKDQRQAAKAVNFGTLYGQMAKGLARNAQLTYGVDMSQDAAASALRQFAIAYPQLAVWQMQKRRQATSTGRVQTRLGLVRDFNTIAGGYINGESVNIPIQGSAAEVLLASMANLKRPIYHNVHDEILLAVPKNEAAEAKAELEEAMINGFLSVFPEADSMLNGLVDVSIGDNWSQVH